ncbi:MAG: ATP-binding cassette domain-containing protein [Thermomicrobiales bacterium]
MLSVNAVTFDIDGIRILDDVTFSIPVGEKVGLVGANGSGKSTLLQLIAGRRKPTSGSIQFIGGGAIGYLPQVPFDTGNATVFDMLARGASGWTAARDAMGARWSSSPLRSEPQMTTWDATQEVSRHVRGCRRVGSRGAHRRNSRWVGAGIDLGRPAISPTERRTEDPRHAGSHC